MNNTECIIFTGGDFDFEKSAKELLHKNYYVICADKGYDYALKCGFSPDVVIGDLDSVSMNSEFSCEVIKYAKEKDDTDTMLAVKLALEKGFKDITLFGVFGGRLDHTFANIQSLAYIYEHGAVGRLVSDNEFVFLLIDSRIQINRKEKTSLSLFSFSEKCVGVTLRGVGYPLTDYELIQSFPIGISNEIVDEYADISLKSGKMLVIQSKI